METSALASTTVMMMLFFGTNALLFLFFQGINLAKTGSSQALSVQKKESKKELSKPFTGSLDCFINVTIELFRTGLIMLLTYICEKHWIFEHSGKVYSRDLFLFVLILFFVYGFYTIKPISDHSVLSREQTEEWKGWMQFIFLLYHYFHAEEVYNSVRVMITCYVWMTGFGNFSFFYVKQDFGWLRVVQMLWRLNFSVLLLMWTHGNTWILYYICPMHTFYFLMVFVTMYIFSSWNHSKWGIRLKLALLGFIIFIIWDVNHGLFDFLFGWLGTTSIIGATNGSVWEYYFRTSLDHWSTFLGMIFALNFPLVEQYFQRSQGWPLIVASALLGGAFLWWFLSIYPLDKLGYNLYHSYFAVVPLTSYIFFRNVTPFLRSGVSMSMHDLGKTTLETYLLQHHIWLTSNAKTLLTIVPNNPWINFALATMLFFFVSKELYRLTMSLRGMIVPDDKNIAFRNVIGSIAIFSLLYLISLILHSLNATIFEIIATCCGLTLVSLLIINRFSKSVSENPTYQALVSKFSLSVGGFMVLLLIAQYFSGGFSVSQMSNKVETNTKLSWSSTRFVGNSDSCLNSISLGHWNHVDCSTINQNPSSTLLSSSFLDRRAFCSHEEWVWDSFGEDCPVSKLSTSRAVNAFKGRKVVFLGDSLIRNTYHSFIRILEPNYKEDIAADLKHRDLSYVVHSSRSNVSVSFLWMPMTENMTSYFKSDQWNGVDCLVAGAAAWDALYSRDIELYKSNLNALSSILAGHASEQKSKTINIWLQPTTIVDAKLLSVEKKQFMTEAMLSEYRKAFYASTLASKFQAVIDPTSVSKGRETSSIDGVHYSPDVYAVMGQMVANAYSLHFPANYVFKVAPKKGAPKPTGAMSFPLRGMFVLALSIIMLITMDNFLGFGWLSLYLFGRSFDWDAAYSLLHKKILKSSESSRAGAGEEMASCRDSNDQLSKDTDNLIEKDGFGKELSNGTAQLV